MSKVSLSTAELLQERLDGFGQGTTTLSKSDLKSLASETSANNASTSSALSGLISDYDTIDINGDGISTSELQTYYTSKATLVNNLNQTSFWQTEDDDSSSSADYFSSISEGITKNALLELKYSITSSGKESPEGLDKLIKNFDEANLDQDGITTLEELQNILSDSTDSTV